MAWTLITAYAVGQKPIVDGKLVAAADALKRLADGNQRFAAGKTQNRTNRGRILLLLLTFITGRIRTARVSIVSLI